MVDNMGTKKWLVLFGILLLALPAMAAEPELLKTRQDMVSYAAGVEIARNFRRQEVPINPDLLLKGVQDEMSGKELLMTEQERRGVMREMQNEVMVKMARKRQLAAEENRQKEDEFLAANKNKEGVITLASGLQYQILKKGEGMIPTDDDSVECNYHATHLDGTELDGTDPGKPALLKVAKLLPGWREAMKIMPEGSTWQLFIPARLAYGEKGAGYEIEPNELLIFKVELLDVK